MIDLHCHILPGLDDGSRNMEESVAMARLAREYGVSAIACTPHVHAQARPLGLQITRERIGDAVEGLREALRQNGVDMEIYSGAEYYLDKPFPLLLEENHPLATINNTNYVMVEFPMLHLPPYLEYSILKSDLDDEELRELIPFLRIIVAHPERNQEVMRNPERVERLKESGAIMQMNLGSLMGIYGKPIRRTAEKLLKKGLFDLVASDAHSENHIRAVFKGAEKKIRKLAGDRAFHLLWEDNPQRIARGEDIELL
jgi:protein-tyrosine phosphatase